PRQRPEQGAAHAAYRLPGPQLCGCAAPREHRDAQHRLLRMRPTDLRGRWRRVQPIMGFVAGHLDDDLSLTALARRARLSFHTAQHQTHGERSMPYSVTKKELAPQPVLIVRRRVRRSDIARTLAEQLGRIFQHLHSSGAVIAGQPFTRYLEWGPGVLTLEIGLPIAHPSKEGCEPAGDIRADTLPGGQVAATTHMGAYEKLNEAHAAVQVWMEENNLRAAGAPWEVYVSDPADVPDPANWRTDIFWPLER